MTAATLHVSVSFFLARSGVIVGLFNLPGRAHPSGQNPRECGVPCWLHFHVCLSCEHHGATTCSPMWANVLIIKSTIPQETDGTDSGQLTHVCLARVCVRTAGKWVVFDYLGSVTRPSSARCQLASRLICSHHIKRTTVEVTALRFYCVCFQIWKKVFYYFLSSWTVFEMITAEVLMSHHHLQFNRSDYHHATMFI